MTEHLNITNLHNIEYDTDYIIPHKIFKNPHIQTMFAKIFRPSRNAAYQRERISINEGDFVDIDWSTVKPKSESLAIVCPGFESDSRRPYVLASVNILNDNGMDVVVINHRGSSGAPSKHYIFAVGDEEDLSQVIDTILEKYDYSKIFLVGYSTGGNLAMKYIADKSEAIDPRIKKAFVTSPTLHLVSTMEQFKRPANKLYLKGFLAVMCKGLWWSRKYFPQSIHISEFFSISNPEEFYDRYCYPYSRINFLDYLTEHSACGHLSKVAVPTMMISSMDDPFIDSRFYPYMQAMNNPYITLRVTKDGGHVGFVDFKGRYYWSERKMVEFLTSEE